MNVIQHKRGDTFSEIAAVPSNYFLNEDDANEVGAITAEVRREVDYENSTPFLDALDVTVRTFDPSPGGLCVFNVVKFDTATWPLKKVFFSIAVNRALEQGGALHESSCLPITVEVRA